MNRENITRCHESAEGSTGKCNRDFISVLSCPNLRFYIIHVLAQLNAISRISHAEMLSFLRHCQRVRHASACVPLNRMSETQKQIVFTT
jgi:hypothetical protein